VERALVAWRTARLAASCTMHYILVYRVKRYRMTRWRASITWHYSADIEQFIVDGLLTRSAQKKKHTKAAGSAVVGTVAELQGWGLKVGWCKLTIIVPRPYHNCSGNHSGNHSIYRSSKFPSNCSSNRSTQLNQRSPRLVSALVTQFNALLSHCAFGFNLGPYTKALAKAVRGFPVGGMGAAAAKSAGVGAVAARPAFVQRTLGRAWWILLTASFNDL